MNEILKEYMRLDNNIELISKKFNIDQKKTRELLSFLRFYFPLLLKLEKELKKYNSKLKSKNKLIDEALKYFANLNSDGKFLRGTLIALGYQNSGKKDDDYIGMALAYEFFQTAILIHDDAIDRSDMRRGKQTINSIYADRFSQIKDNEHVANSLSICVGDLGFYMANQIIVEKYYNHPFLAPILKYFNDVVMETACGEFIDVYLPNERKLEDIEPLIMDIYRLKTALYTVTGPYCLGMILSGEENVSEVEKILIDIGVAYQIRDDIFGIYGKFTQKSVTSDIEEFKQTILYSYAISTPYKNELLKYYGKKTGKKELEKVREILDVCGAKKYAENKMKKLFDRARKNIEESNLGNKEELLGLMVYLELSAK